MVCRGNVWNIYCHQWNIHICSSDFAPPSGLKLYYILRWFVSPLQFDQESCRESRPETVDGECEYLMSYCLLHFFRHLTHTHLSFSSGASFYQTVGGRAGWLCRLVVQHHWTQSACDTHPWYSNVRPVLSTANLTSRSSNDWICIMGKMYLFILSTKWV